jgi:putative transposon-encoded protein
MGQEIEIKVTGYQIIEKIVKASGNSGRVYVPIEWVGKKVKVVLIEPINENTTGNEENKSAAEKVSYRGA